ncbi:MAG: alpha/beta fold hydrolase [Chthonomonas sp.]|nr:alpha/beta fold hydrolase [Chthonomonas sp.]
MIWVVVAILLYVAIQVVAVLVSIRPYRIPIFHSPGALGAPQESVEFQNPDGIMLRGWWSETPGALDVVILVHGYMMNRSESAAVAHWFWKRGFSTLCIDLRAHGRSGGKRCGFGWHERADVESAIDWVKAKVPEGRVLLWGSSMGAAACAFATLDRRGVVHGLILDSAFSRLLDAVSGWWVFVGGKWLSIFLWPTPLVARLMLKFSPKDVDVAHALEAAGELPILLLHGTHDTLADPSQASRNFNVLGSRGELVWFEGCQHAEGRWVHPEQYYAAMDKFLTDYSFLPQASADELQPS